MSQDSTTLMLYITFGIFLLGASIFFTRWVFQIDEIYTELKNHNKLLSMLLEKQGVSKEDIESQFTKK